MDALGRKYHIEMWRSAAESIGAQCIGVDDALQIVRGVRSIRVRNNSTTVNEPQAIERAADKAAVRSLLSRHGIPVPKGIALETRDLEQANRMLAGARRPLVVKPADSTCGGVGVSMNVTNSRLMRTAVAWARSFGRRVLIEEQVPGDCYRVLVMDGQVLDTIVRHPPAIVGDGASTIRQLIHRENEMRLEAARTCPQIPIRFDVDLHNTLASQGLTLSSRPARGRAVVLKRVINENAERDNSPANQRLCPAILEQAIQAAELLGLRLAGVDVICDDPDLPLETSGGAILEVNAVPGLYYHYINRNGDVARPVAERILARFFDGEDQRNRSVTAYR